MEYLTSVWVFLSQILIPVSSDVLEDMFIKSYSVIYTIVASQKELHCRVLFHILISGHFLFLFL